MMLMNVTRVAHSYGIREVLKGVEVEIHRGERIGLVGPNGEGKSTLMRILAGVEEPEEGMVSRHAAWAYVPQALEAPGGQTVSEWFAEQGVTPLDGLAKELGLPEHVWERPVSTLSGGEQTKAALLAAMSRNPALLLLDEPTNHLDLATVEWLENWLKGSKMSVVVISHDRRFLDEVTTSTWELKQGKVAPFPGSYSAYAAWVQNEEARVQKQYDEYLKEKEQLEEAVRRKKEWAAKGEKGRKTTDTFARCLKGGDKASAARIAAHAKAFQKRLEKLEPKEKPEKRLTANTSFLNIELSERPVLVRGEDVSYAYEAAGPRVLEKLNFEVERGDRIALVGPNGAGKSTLLRLFTGELEAQQGTLRVTPTAKMGYFDQVFASLELERTLLDDLLKLPDMEKTTARLFLGSFLFRGDEVFRPLSTLSYGERVRFVFCKLILARKNMLVLDEPTNHLDIRTREKIEESLLDYPGAFLCASHDRYFLEKMTNKVWELQNGKLVVHPYGFKEYMERKKEAAQQPKSLTKKQRQQQIKEQILVMETRLAHMSWELMQITDAKKKEELDREYIAMSREKNRLAQELN